MAAAAKVVRRAMPTVVPVQIAPSTASVFTVRSQDGTMVPVLIVDGRDGAPRVVPEVVAFMQSQVARGESLAKLRGVSIVLGLLHDYNRFRILLRSDKKHFIVR